MEYFEVDPYVQDVVDTAVIATSHMEKQGFSAAEEDSYNYSEATAEMLAKFNILDLINIGQNDDFEFDNSNKRMEMISIEKKYAVPQQQEATQEGAIVIAFSSPIKQLTYEELSKKLIFLYTESSKPKRALKDSDRILQQIMMDRQTLAKQQDEQLTPARRRGRTLQEDAEDASE